MPDSYTPPRLAKRYSIKPSKVLGWIRSGELEAINISAKPGQRPRWVVTPEALVAFESRRSSSLTVKSDPIRRRKDRRVTEYFQ